MKKFHLISLFVTLIFVLSTIAIAAPPPPTPTGNTINACYKKKNGQLRMVSAPTDCKSSELPISWNIGPVTSRISDVIAATIAGSATEWVFAGTPVSVNILAGEQLTGVADATLGITVGTASFAYDLCYATTTDPVTITNFAGANAPIGTVTAAQASFTAAGSVTPAVGTYLVGFCVLNDGVLPLNNNDVVNGWVIAE